ncbi:hypothetical protein POM88_037271 [Heracleum sosnowskyi]|uniref:Uncharacterized protein n=1 Tax=Heracleum sosnowskyi TaxID=360622 RepID=A0AAD8MFS5_9APIA|nr:hypothetical protein POM88_037271 [Heracleum sosnowskyi]
MIVKDLRPLSYLLLLHPLAISKAGLQASEVDYYEINEAFSVVAPANKKLFGISDFKIMKVQCAASKGILGLCIDASAGLFYTYDQNSIFQVSVNDEGRDMWKVYLDLKVYAQALANCRDPFQRDQVYLEQAEVAFSAKDFVRAASFYAKVSCSLCKIEKAYRLAPGIYRITPH